MNISIEGAGYFDLFGFIRISETTISSCVLTLVVCILGILLGSNLKKRPGKLQVLVEKGVSMIHGMVLETMGPHNAGWTPFIGTIFLSSMLGSYIGLTGFFKSTTADLSCTLTWALMVSVIIWYQSIKRNGFWNWLKGFTEPIIVMTPMNILSEIAQPFSMALRHFGNVAGGGVITSILYTALGVASTVLMKYISGTIFIPIIMAGLGIGVLIAAVKVKDSKIRLGVQVLGIAFLILGGYGIVEYTGLITGVPVLALGVPAVLSLYFDLFSGFVQALVFTLLTMVYIAGSCPPPEEKNNQ